MELLLPIFCDIDDFCKEYEKYCKTHLLLDESQYLPKTSMSLSEIMTIVVYFHLSNHRTFKWYYKKYICVTLRDYFPKLLSYNRFIEVMPMVIVPALLYLMKFQVGKCLRTLCVLELVLLIPPRFVFASTKEFQFIKYLMGLQRGEKVLLDGFTNSNFIWLSMRKEKVQQSLILGLFFCQI